jgi:hypothetical protein
MKPRTSGTLTLKTVVLAFAAVIAVAGTFVYGGFERRPQPPSEARLSACPNADTRVTLFTIQRRVAYDVPDKAFVVDSGRPDMLVGTYHVVTHRGDRQGAKLEIGSAKSASAMTSRCLRRSLSFPLLETYAPLKGAWLERIALGMLRAVTDGGW